MHHNLIRLFLLLALMLTACAPTVTAVPTSAPISPTDTALRPTQTSIPPAPTEIPTQAATGVARPFPQHVTYAPGSILPNHRTQAQLDDDVRVYYDAWKQTYLLEAGASVDGHPLYRVAFGSSVPNRDQTVSEGQGFGMLIVPIMAGHDPDAQTLFDGLWEFARAHPSEVDPRLMDWKVPESVDGDDSAFDGDADMALGLLLANAQWGSAGRIDYQAEAEILISGILESTIGPDSRLPMLGDWVDVAGMDFNQYTPRSSDFMLANFRAYGRAAGDPVWDEVIANSQDVMLALQESHSPASGLMSDFIVMTGETHTPQPAPPDFLEGADDGHYSYNAGRVPWRLGSDALLNNDAASRAIAQKISAWIEASANGDPFNIRAGYDLDGQPLPDSDYFTTFFVAPMGVAAMTNPAQQDWLNAIYDAVYNQHSDYYEDTVTLLCLLVMTGNFWTP
ncbi:MAG: beta-glucanase [Chloroflexi bacterium]|nr:beta-glucanase [Chloroflexota bacterium]